MSKLEHASVNGHQTLQFSERGKATFDATRNEMKREFMRIGERYREWFWNLAGNDLGWPLTDEELFRLLSENLTPREMSDLYGENIEIANGEHSGSANGMAPSEESPISNPSAAA